MKPWNSKTTTPGMSTVECCVASQRFEVESVRWRLARQTPWSTKIQSIFSPHRDSDNMAVTL